MKQYEGVWRYVIMYEGEWWRIKIYEEMLRAMNINEGVWRRWGYIKVYEGMWEGMKGCEDV